MTVTRADLVGNPAYGHPPTAQDLSRDHGTYNLVLDRGRLGWTAAKGDGVSHDSGTYRVTGDLVTFHITGGHDIGETWSYRWSIYRGELTFRPPPASAPQGPPDPMFSRWHRVGR
jgi:hypothetical protein